MGRLLIMSLALLAAGCGGIISNQKEVEIGRGVHAEMQVEYRLLEENDAVTKWAKALVVPLQTASAEFRDPGEIGGYKVRVIADNELINAFAAPGGYTYISTGLILSAKTCAEIAGVMGHELAHVTERHSVKAIEKGMLAQTLVGIILPDGGLAADASLALFSFLQGTTFSRDAEAEADEVGLQISHDAGYTPYGLAAFFEKLLAAEGGSGPRLPEFLSSHPATADRIKSVKSMIKKRYGSAVRADRNTACRSTPMTLTKVQSRIRNGQVQMAPRRVRQPVKKSVKKAVKKSGS